jgi:hypothetical protein
MGAAVIVALFAGTAHAQTPAPESKLSRALRSTKMVNIASPWRYDAGACHTLQSLILRRAAISRCALGATSPADIAGRSDCLRQLLGCPASKRF